MTQEQAGKSTAQRCIIALNVGSSSVKAKLYRVGEHDEPQLSEIDTANFSGNDPHEVIEWIKQCADTYTIAGVGHRLVHGGPWYDRAVWLDNHTKEQIAALADFDPEHTPQALQMIEEVQAALPDSPQFASFDTAFFRDMPQVAKRLPLPRKYFDEGLRRYGFHGLSYTYLQETLGKAAGEAIVRGRVIYAHLGSGVSLVATRDGRPIDTTMGFTPAAGVLMSTRSGDLDPGIGLFMQKRHQMGAEEFYHTVNAESGLLGISGYTADMKRLLDDEATDPHAAEAVELFCYRIAQAVGSLATTIGGLDTLVFSGGIGERSAVIRRRITNKLMHLGVRIDDARNKRHDQIISAEGSAAKVYMLATDEMHIVARDTWQLIREGGKEMDTNDVPLSNDMVRRIDAYWRAANYLSVGQIYLNDNPLLKEPLQRKHVKNLLLGHWGTTPGQNFIYAHLNRVIRRNDLNMLYISGPGHGGPALVSNTYLEGTFTEYYPDVTQDESGMRKLFKMFSFPGGLSSHVSPQIPGSIHEGGELGYSLSHAFGAVLDNPDLIVACVVGDGEAETGPLATAWHSNKFINPKSDGAVLPILHLNGYKISNPTVLARIEHEELEQLFRGYGWTPYFVEGDDPEHMHQLMAAKLDEAVAEIQRVQSNARNNNDVSRPRWPMIILNSPKGWTGPDVIEGKQIENNFRSHQVPLAVDDAHPENVAVLEAWLRSYRPEELFDEYGRLQPELMDMAPHGMQRMGANPHVDGGALLRELRMPDFRDYAITISQRGVSTHSNMHVLGPFLRDIIALNEQHHNFRIFGPDELVSNRLDAVFEATNRQWNARTKPTDEFLSTEGAVLDSMLSEHQAQGWLEGYLLTGRHGLLHSYEAFIRIVDSMVTQHAKWIKMADELPWRRPISSLNYLLTSHVWRQDHNGFTHQDPGFIDHLLNKKSSVVRIYLPPDANTTLSVADHCLKSRNYINLTITGKHESPQWLSMDEAVEHCTRGISIWDWASNDDGEPDVVMASAGDVPTLETMAAVSILRKYLPDLKVRVVNVVDLMRLEPATEHPHGLSDADYDRIFTKDKEIIFAFHGYPWVIHRLTYRRANRNLHVRGYKEEGTITTAFDMTVRNDMDRFHLVIDVIERAGVEGEDAEILKAMMHKKLIDHTEYITTHGVDMPEIQDWRWSAESDNDTQQ